MNEREINELHRKSWAAAVEVYGSTYAVPFDEASRISEHTRARFALLLNPEKSKIQILREYNIHPDVISEMGEVAHAQVEGKKKRKQVLRDLERWSAENVGAQTNPVLLAEALGLSKNTTAKFIKDNPTVFICIKRGIYEVRDPVAERKREMSK